MNFAPHAIAFDADAASLLSACGLPTSDLQAAAGEAVALFGCRADGALAGMVGLEWHGPHALLRSLAVTPAARGSGLGALLVGHAERQARLRGVRTLYLLTTTAPEFFARLGYRPAAREEAPAEIAASTQFSQLCPASSAFMRKPLDD